MTMRPAMERRVRGEKCGVIMMRMLASGKDNLWGLRMRSSSTIMTGGGSWPVNAILNLPQQCGINATRSFNRLSWPLLRRTIEVLQAEASSTILSSLQSSDLEQHGFTLLNWRVTNTRSWELNLQPTRNTGLLTLPITSTCEVMLTTDLNLLHDDDVDSIHGHEEQRLPPEPDKNVHPSFHTHQIKSSLQRHHASIVNSINILSKLWKCKFILE